MVERLYGLFLALKWLEALGIRKRRTIISQEESVIERIRWWSQNWWIQGHKLHAFRHKQTDALSVGSRSRKAACGYKPKEPIGGMSPDAPKAKNCCKKCLKLHPIGRGK